MANRYLAEAQQRLRAGQYLAAAELCTKSIKLGKDTAAARRLLADCHYHHGAFHNARSGRLDAAEAEFLRALEIYPDHADAANDLGALCLMNGAPERALDYFRAAVHTRPREPRYLANLVRGLRGLDRLAEAAAPLATLAEIDPANNGAYLINDALLVHDVPPDGDYPARIRREIRLKFERLAALDLHIADPLGFSTAYIPLSYHGVSNVDIVTQLAALYLKFCPGLAWQAPHVARWRGARGRIKLGVVSRFFRNHSIGNTSRGLVEMLDREHFEVILIRLEPSSGDEIALAMNAAADKVVTLDGGDLAAARETIARLELDILFYQDIGMEPFSYFLACARLAPVQLTSFGHPDTTGIPNLDFFLSAQRYELPGAQAHYSERLIELPEVGTLAYYHRPKAPQTLSRADVGLAAAERIYLCPQSLFKVQPVMDRIFQRIVELDARATIVLIDSARRSQRAALEARMYRDYPRLREHVRFVPGLAFEKYLALVAAADVLLDTVHFNGQNTTLEALALGTPVVTYPRSLQRSRHGYGMYQAMGFMELVAADEDDYARIAVRVANDAAYREHCRRRIAASCGVLFENRGFITRLQEALIEMMGIRAAALG